MKLLPPALFVAISISFSAGCATTVADRDNPAAVNANLSLHDQCRAEIDALDVAVAFAGTADARHHRLRSFPWLRSSRFLASFDLQGLNDAGFSQWLALVAEQGAQGSAIEFQNLATELRNELLGNHPQLAEPSRWQDCAKALNAGLADSAKLRKQLQGQAKPADDYFLFNRMVGAYPLTLLGVKRGIAGWHEEAMNDAVAPLAERLPVSNRQLYQMPQAALVAEESFSTVSALLKQSADNALGLPLPDAAAAEQLLARFAPRFVINVESDYDLPVEPRAAKQEGVNVVASDQSAPVHAYLSHTRFGDDVLLQLNYVIWFAGRPAESKLDLLAGVLDGIQWRLTLDTDGRPLLYDSIHSCGCYHLFFPSDRLAAKADGFFEEQKLLPMRMPNDGGRAVVIVDSVGHYIMQLAAELPLVAGSHDYELQPYDSLRRHSSDANGRSLPPLFNAEGLVEGTERLERYVLWPMGVPEPGGMRIAGHHATAFVGRRHFDDPRFLDEEFVRVGQRKSD